ncbi:MAG: hypothetical protein O3A00_08890 [Planctomycetota bacterium]|nr:hypothetical protein [Planctomycetota bacterium]
MAQQDSQLQSLRRYRENIRDQYRQLMAQLLADGRRLDEQRGALQLGQHNTLRQLTRAEEKGQVNLAESVGHRQHVAHQSSKIEQLNRQRELNNQHVELCRQSLVQADQDVQALVNLQDKRISEQRAAGLKREQIEMEDAWSSIQASRF